MARAGGDIWASEFVRHVSAHKTFDIPHVWDINTVCRNKPCDLTVTVTGTIASTPFGRTPPTCCPAVHFKPSFEEMNLEMILYRGNVLYINNDSACAPTQLPSHDARCKEE